MNAYAQYLSDVLGLRQVMMPTPVASADEVLAARPAFFHSAQGPQIEGRDFHRPALAVVNWVQDPRESLFDPQVAELFNKMLAAMKLPAEKVLVLDCVMNERGLIPNGLFKVCEPSWVLFFSREPAHLGEVQIKGPARWIETLSPALLLEQPGAKKQVWADMQKVMRELR